MDRRIMPKAVSLASRRKEAMSDRSYHVAENGTAADEESGSLRSRSSSLRSSSPSVLFVDDEERDDEKCSTERLKWTDLVPLVRILLVRRSRVVLTASFSPLAAIVVGAVISAIRLLAREVC